MFNQNNEEKKLDWMYKGATSMVEREEYLLGRSVDKTLEHLNEEEKQKQQGIIAPPKNRVEHECIPPSIRDFNKVVQTEQVDLSAKLQEDPLVTIKKREEESRQQFLQNPVQLKKLQKALKAQAKKHKKKKKHKHAEESDSNLDAKLAEKLLGGASKKISKEEKSLNIILCHKYEQLKHKLTKSDLEDILNGKITSSDDSSEEEEKIAKSKKRRRYSSDVSEEERERGRNKSKQYGSRSQERYKRGKSNKNSSEGDDYKKKREKYKDHQQGHNKVDATKRNNRNTDSDNERERLRTTHRSNNYDSDDSDYSKNKKLNYGLVKSDGSKLALSKTSNRTQKDSSSKTVQTVDAPPVKKHVTKKLTEEEKEKLRREMMENAVWRDKERTRNVRNYREEEKKEKKEGYDPEFIHKQLLMSAHSSSVESRIKANVNNIQRSKADMNKHFSRR